ncbi:MAG: hypothetical protein WBO32_11900 [Cyclobacteriaceae bacterium]
MGNRIYKYYDNGGVAIVLNNDLTLYDEIKTKKFEELEAAFNLVITDESQDGWGDFFVLDTDGTVISEKPIFKLRFATDLDANGEKSVRNISLVEPATATGSVTFEWKYANGSSFVGKTPNKTFSANESLILSVGNGAGTIDVTEATVLACSVENFTITYMGGNSVKFELPGYNQTTSPYNILWEFSNGQTATGSPVTKSFTSSGTATCKAVRKSDGTLMCQFTKPFQLKCGDKKTISTTNIFDNVNGTNQKWKLDCSLWVKSGEVGCKVKYLKRVLLAWVPGNNEGSHVDIAGKYKRETTTPSYSCSDITASGSHNLGSGIYPTSVSFTIPEVNTVFKKNDNNLLNSGHSIKVNGAWIGPGIGSTPRLILN